MSTFLSSSSNAFPNLPKPELELNQLSESEKDIILHQGTERPFTGKYNDFSENGIYKCRQCNAMLYRSDDKFTAHCGWPAFDDELPSAIKKIADRDGKRIEIRCNTCDGHLGHVFAGEHLTEKNVRHCVNSTSLQFVPADKVKYGQAIFAGGCFWGVEYYMQKLSGVLETTVGYIGGSLENPTYQQVCTGTTGHTEAILITFDPVRVSYETLAKVFFEIHDPTQTDGQGPDIGSQYVSEIYVYDEDQQKIIKKLIARLEEKGLKVATKIKKATPFWKAEDYHQDHYLKEETVPYCHAYKKRF